jgi:membrane associated rhomboid family serine protease
MFPLKDDIPSRSFPFVTYLLIAGNLFVFYQEVKMPSPQLLEVFVSRYALIPHALLADLSQTWTTLVSHMFLHGSWGHVLSNMWFLFIFGDNVEDKLGHVRFLIYYLLVGLGAASAQIYMNQASVIPMVGASGAIAGVLGGYFILFPGARVMTLIPIFVFIRIIEIPAFFFLGLWFVMQMFNGFGSLAVTAARGDMGGVAWWAHAGGFAAGFVLINFFRRSLPRR